MPGSGNLEHGTGPLFSAGNNFRKLLERRFVSRYNDLIGSIIICKDNPVGGIHFAKEAMNFFRGKRKYCHHCSVALGRGLVHELPPFGRNGDRFFLRHGPARSKGRYFAERMTKDNIGPDTLFLHTLEITEGNGNKNGLKKTGLKKFFFRTMETKFFTVFMGIIARASDQGFKFGTSLKKVVPHAHFLRTLTRK